MSEKFEPYDIEKTQEEATKLQQKIEAGEVSSYSEAERLIEAEKQESELSPEVIEKIMAKVQDIDQEGIAFSALGLGEKLPERFYEEEVVNLQRILKEGLLGHPGQNRGERVQGEERHISKEQWVKNARKHEKGRGIVHFNIVGRSLDIDNERRSKGSREISLVFFHRGIRILFSLDNFTDVSPFADRITPDKSRTRAYFMSQHPMAVNRRRERRKRPPVDEKISAPEKTPSQFGFLLSQRVTPRFFTGLVIEASPFASSEGEHMQGLEKHEQLRIQEERRIVAAQKVASAMLEGNDDLPDRLLPIYDEGGNLLWPKQMIYEKVKEFVTERDKKIKEDEAEHKNKDLPPSSTESSNPPKAN